MCGSLKEAHDRGLVHRDVKPHNLMLCRHGGEHDVVKVLDFGLVKELANEHTRDITQFARVLGTPLYMAPERLRDPADADARADIYALGAVAFFILTGRRVFETQSDHDLVYQVLNVPAPSIAGCGAADAPADPRRPRRAVPRQGSRGAAAVDRGSGRRSRGGGARAPVARGGRAGVVGELRRRARNAGRRRRGPGGHGRAHMTAPSRAQPCRCISRQSESLVVKRWLESLRGKPWL